MTLGWNNSFYQRAQFVTESDHRHKLLDPQTSFAAGSTAGSDNAKLAVTDDSADSKSDKIFESHIYE
jgi:hypothetical protein